MKICRQRAGLVRSHDRRGDHGDGDGGERHLDRVPIDGSPGFYKRGRWVVFPYRDLRGKQHWGKGRNLTEARRKKAAILTDVDRGEHRPRARVKFEEYARDFIDTYQGRTKKTIEPHTRENYRQNLKDATAFFKGMLLSEIEPQDIKAYAAHVAKRGPRCYSCRGYEHKRAGCERCGGTGRRDGELSPDSVRLALAPVKLLFATAFEDGVLRVNPAAGVRVLRPQTSRRTIVDEDDEGEVKALTERDLEAFFTVIARAKSWRRWANFFRVLLELGIRIGEAIELRWRDVDLGTGRVRIRRGFYRGHVTRLKSRYATRTLRLTPATLAALRQLREATKAREGDLVFTAARGGRIHPQNLMTDVLKPAALAAAIGDWPGFHTFRHTCATLLFTNAKWNPKQVQLWLGHHSASFTLDTYIHLLPSDLPEPAVLAPAPSLPDRVGGEGERPIAAEA